MSHTPCPICNSEEDKAKLCKVSFTYQSEFDLSECPNCQVIYCDPTPTTEQFIRFYSSEGYDFNRWKQESKADEYIKTLNKKQKSGRFLDIGCATGYMINKIKQDSNWQVYGVELSEHPVKFARDVLGLDNVVHGDLFSVNYDDNFFDYVNISDVLEHVPNPREFLQECRRILKPDGYIHLDVPNGYNDSRGLINFNNQFHKAGCHASGHVYFFQKETLHYLFDQLDFDIVRAQTVGIKNGLRNIGWLPKKSNWHAFFKPRDKVEVAVKSEIKLIAKKEHPDFYYRYRYLKHVWFTLPGLHNFGLNFTIVLKPSHSESKKYNEE
jgi:2-polyprenyl-3-methyl-5-hydroxy-6-metoxy-1,4-benzoquinol methylase